MQSAKGYGLTVETMRFYRMQVAYGYSWKKAMADLRKLYEHNKTFFNNKESQHGIN